MSVIRSSDTSGRTCKKAKCKISEGSVLYSAEVNLDLLDVRTKQSDFGGKIQQTGS